MTTLHDDRTVRNVSDTDVFRVLFVCHGNVCRSPLAEVVLRAKIPDTLARDVEIGSAGLETFTGLSASVEAELAARMKGYDLSRHRSRQASESVIENSDLILCMEPGQTRYLQEKYPHMAARIHTFQAFCAGEDVAVDDPYQQDVTVYIRTLTKITAGINRCKTKIWDMVRHKKRKRMSD
ncbi:hypothetical protein JXA80_06415 [bacterium]|nr:hypothetical protein [candidate division CSSED10-310 bacterium]